MKSPVEIKCGYADSKIEAYFWKKQIFWTVLQKTSYKNKRNVLDITQNGFKTFLSVFRKQKI